MVRRVGAVIDGECDSYRVRDQVGTELVEGCSCFGLSKRDRRRRNEFLGCGAIFDLDPGTVEGVEGSASDQLGM